jgi:hypothetical protein
MHRVLTTKLTSWKHSGLWFVKLISKYSNLSLTYTVSFYRIIRKSPCTWRSQHRQLPVMFKLSPASLQTFTDTRLTLTPSVISNSNYVIMVTDWNCLKYFFVFFLSCNHQVGLSQWPRGLRRRSTAARLLRSWVRIRPVTCMFVCFVRCDVEVSATNWSLVQRSPTDCGASLCVIKKPREQGGHRPRWATEPEKIIIIIIIIIIIYV